MSRYYTGKSKPGIGNPTYTREKIAEFAHTKRTTKDEAQFGTCFKTRIIVYPSDYFELGLKMAFRYKFFFPWFPFFIFVWLPDNAVFDFFRVRA